MTEVKHELTDHEYAEYLFLLQSGDLRKAYRANQYADLAGEDLPYPELAHGHWWNEDHFCTICGADGAA